jgi:hypothetical protein
MNRLVVLLALLLLSRTFILAQDDVTTDRTTEETTSTLPFDVTGFVDVYYQYNLNGASLGTTSFTSDHNSFALGMAKLGLSKEIGKVGFGIDLAFGPRADAANGYSGTTFAPVQQLFVTYAPTDKITLTAGNFGTHVGYEYIDASSNFHYSTSYMFSKGPFYHTGVKADFVLTDKIGAMIGVFDDTDSKFDVVDGKHIGAQLSYASDAGEVYLNFLRGTEGSDSSSFNQVDLMAAFPLSDKLSLGVNATVKPIKNQAVGSSDATWYGAALYLGFQAKENLGLGLRAEYFNDADAYIFGTQDLSVIDITASANITIDKLTIIPEFRIDIFSEDFTFDADGNAANISPTFILAAYYAF